MKKALQLQEIDEKKLEKFASALCDHKSQIENDEEAMKLWSAMCAV